MNVIDQTLPADTPIAGIAHSTWAGEADGLQQLSVWRQRLARGACTPPHRHDCDEVVLCLAGEGEVHEGNQVQRFRGGSTVTLPRGRVHQLFNVGSAPLELIGLFAATPVPTHTPEGAALDLPWRS